MVLWELKKFVPHLECGQGEETLIVQLETPILWRIIEKVYLTETYWRLNKVSCTFEKIGSEGFALALSPHNYTNIHYLNNFFGLRGIRLRSQYFLFT